GGGLAIYNPRTGRFKVYNQENGTLLSNKVLALLPDSRGNMWVGMYGGGLSKFGRNDDRPKQYTEKDGLQNMNVYQIVEDATGRIWVSTNTGISSFDRGVFRNFTRHNGLQNNNFNH